MSSAESPMTRRDFLGALLGSAIYLSTDRIPAQPITVGGQSDTRSQATTHPLRALTLNVWDIPIASDRPERMKAIGEQVTALDPDVIALQEAFTPEDRDRILGNLAPGRWPYSHYFASGLVGSGLMIISRYPIVDASYYRFRLTGRPERLLEADFYAGKGIGYVRLQTPVGQLDVYDTHALAQYVSDADDEYTAHRASNLYEAARFIDGQSRGNPVLFCGDLNTRHQPGYRLVTLLGKLTDCDTTANPGDPGITYSTTNPYNNGEPSQRIDYVFVRNGASLGFNIRSARVVLKEQVSGRPKAYSDHYGVIADLELTPNPESRSQVDPQDVKRALDDLAASLRRAIANVQGRQSAHIAQASIGLVATPGLNIAGRLLRRRWRIPGGVVQHVGTPLAAAYTALNGSLLLFSLPDESQSLHELAAEVDWQIKARRAFNGITW
jgi:endonuclease/exonuclease/phosphatase family metal-dependent hydrolase